MWFQLTLIVQALGFSATDQTCIWKALAAILHLGNVRLDDAGDGESSVVGNKDVVHTVMLISCMSIA